LDSLSENRIGGNAGEAVAARPADVYAALDLGTNNCRLLVAKPMPGSALNGAEGLRVIDAFSRIVRLGEGVAHSGKLCDAAIERTLDALDICRDKMDRRRVTRARLIATEACRAAANGPEFIRRVAQRTGLTLEIINRETEARLAATGCASLADPSAHDVVLFDIGGGSTEVVWLARDRAAQHCATTAPWVSIELGVVTLAERFGGHVVDADVYEQMIQTFGDSLAPFAARFHGRRVCPRFHLLGTSGTVTTIAGVHLGLERYERRRVDGLWMSKRAVDDALTKLRAMSFAERAAQGCIGPDRADLVLAGCAIFEAIRRAFPAPRVRIADRGLREGILIELMRADKSRHHQA
jgi:exopolyphosphatase/guanosine-5'-triphosphate,3'-diphosphate pyrophosphatase